jgi:hypothetical protein
MARAALPRAAELQRKLRREQVDGVQRGGGDLRVAPVDEHLDAGLLGPQQPLGVIQDIVQRGQKRLQRVLRVFRRNRSNPGFGLRRG